MSRFCHRAWSIPEELADRIAYDRQAHTLTAHGVLTDEDAAALRTLSVILVSRPRRTV
jgi:hypothetical protein